MSAISVVQTIQAATSTNATSHATAVLTPGTSGNVVVLACHHSNLTAATAMAAPTGACLSSVDQIQSLAIDVTRRMDVWVGRVSSTASAITFNFNELSDATVWSVTEFANVDTTRGYNNAISGLTSNISTNSGTGTALSTSARATQHATNAMIAIWGVNSVGSDEAPEGGWSELSDNGTSAPAVGLTVHWRVGSDTTPSATVSSSVDWVALSLELWGIDGSGDWNTIETFTKTNGNGWGNDQLWGADITGVTTVLNNQAGCNAANVYANAIITNDSSSGNHEGRVLASTMTLSGQSVIGVRLRCHSQDNASYEFIRVGASTLGGFTVLLRHRSTGGTYTTLAGPTTVARAALGTAEQLYFTANGNTLTCYLDGAQVLAATSTLLFSSRNRGGMVIRASATNDTLADNFQFGDIGQTNSPKALAGTSDLGRNSAKATSNWRKRNIGKGATANNAFAVLSSRIARLQARLPIANVAHSTFFTAQVEGFLVRRPLVAKIGPATSAKATLTTGQKKYVAKVSQTFAGGGIFRSAILDVKAGVQGSEINLVSSARAVLIRKVGSETKVFQSNNLLGHYGGSKTFFTATAATAASVFAYLPSRVTYTVRIPTVTNLVGIEWETPEGTGGFFVPPYYLEGHTTLVRPQFADRLFRHYKPRPEGHNVYIYSDGTVSESDPDSYSTMWRESDRHQQTLPNAATVVRIFWGGHDGEHVSQEEAALLVAAGYTVRGYHA